MDHQARFPLVANVFQATDIDQTYLEEYLGKLEVGKWYYAKVDWKSTVGPFHNEQEADEAFQKYITGVKLCPTCHDPD